MATLVLREVRDDLREATRYYRDIRPAAVGKRLAEQVLASFKKAIASVEATPLSRPEHPDIPGARYVIFDGFPYVAFYTVRGDDIVVVSIEDAAHSIVAPNQASAIA